MTQHMLAIWSLGPLPFLNPAYIKCSLGNSNFLKEITSLSILLISLFLCICHWRRLSFLSLLFSGTLHSSEYIFPFLPFSFSVLFFSELFVRPPPATILPSCISFSWGRFWSSPPVQYYVLPLTVLQVICLPDLITWIYSSPPLYNHKGFDLGQNWMAYRFSLLSSI